MIHTFDYAAGSTDFMPIWQFHMQIMMDTSKEVHLKTSNLCNSVASQSQDESQKFLQMSYLELQLKVGKILNAKNYLLTKSKLDILAMVASVSFFCSQQCTWQPSLEFWLFYRQNCSLLTCLPGWELQRERDFTFKIVCKMKDPCKIWDTI